MNRFNEFSIKPQTKGFEGDKIKIERVLNKTIVVYSYKIEKSKFDKGSGKCMYIQIMVDSCMRLLFSGSINLMNMIEQVPKDKFPFETVIVKENERFEFT